MSDGSERKLDAAELERIGESLDDLPAELAHDRRWILPRGHGSVVPHDGGHLLVVHASMFETLMARASAMQKELVAIRAELGANSDEEILTVVRRMRATGELARIRAESLTRAMDGELRQSEAKDEMDLAIRSLVGARSEETTLAAVGRWQSERGVEVTEDFAFTSRPGEFDDVDE